MAVTKVPTTKIANSFSSSAEINTGAKWINGQDIWKKTVAATGPLASGNNTFAHGVSGITALVNLEGWSDVGTWTPIHYYQSGTNWTTARATTTDLILVLGSDRAGSGSFSLTLYYTKG